MTPEEEAESLRSRLEQWNAEYYRYDAPTVTDSEYDRSLNRLRDLETQYPQLLHPDSPTQRVGCCAAGRVCLSDACFAYVVAG